MALNARIVLAVAMVTCMTNCISGKRLNVLFLVSDDMRPEIGAYSGSDFPTPDHPKMYTPNLDKLASSSLLLKKAYVQQAVCSPSRTSLLTGRRPDTTRVHDLVHYWRHAAGNFTTIPQYFKEHGYKTFGMGKIFHPGVASGGDDPMSWTEPYFRPSNKHWEKHRHRTWFAADDDEVRNFPLLDMQTANQAVKVLKEVAAKAKTGEEPVFVAAGFHKPHLPFLFPAKFLSYYPESDIRLPSNPHAPVDMPEAAWSYFDELRAFSDVTTQYGYGGINTTLPDVKVKELRRAYYSAISYTDSLVGQVVSALHDVGLDSNTVVSFWGDHGWQLGEHGEWCKHTNFELATHAPMMIRVPGLTDHGVTTERLTEFVDLFPTLAEAAGLPTVPQCPADSRRVETCTEGVSMVPLMTNPDRPWKGAAFSQYPRMLCDGDILMGYRIRTGNYSYTEWTFFNDVTFGPDWHRRRGTELYDHVIDPMENVNRAGEKKYREIKKTLSKQLRAGWRQSLPPTF